MSIDDHPGTCLSCGEPAEDTDLYYCGPCFDALPDPFHPRGYVLTPDGAAFLERLLADPPEPTPALVALLGDAP